MRHKHYTPPLNRFLICALYHEAKERGVPMTQLANELIEAGLKDSSGWQRAQEQVRLGEEVNEYHTK